MHRKVTLTELHHCFVSSRSRRKGFRCRCLHNNRSETEKDPVVAGDRCTCTFLFCGACGVAQSCWPLCVGGDCPCPMCMWCFLNVSWGDLLPLLVLVLGRLAPPSMCAAPPVLASLLPSCPCVGAFAPPSSSWHRHEQPCRL